MGSQDDGVEDGICEVRMGSVKNLSHFLSRVVPAPVGPGSAGARSGRSPEEERAAGSGLGAGDLAEGPEVPDGRGRSFRVLPVPSKEPSGPGAPACRLSLLVVGPLRGGLAHPSRLAAIPARRESACLSSPPSAIRARRGSGGSRSPPWHVPRPITPDRPGAPAPPASLGLGPGRSRAAVLNVGCWTFFVVSFRLQASGFRVLRSHHLPQFST